MKTTQDFIERYYPNYSSSDEIALFLDLSSIVAGDYEEDSEAHQMFERTYKDDWEELERDYDSVAQSVYQKAIEGYLASYHQPDVSLIASKWDVYKHFDCTEEEAHKVIRSLDKNEYVGETIDSMIKIIGEEFNLTPINDVEL